MLELLASTIAFTAVVAMGLALLAVLTLVPFVLTLTAADQTRVSSARWGTLALVGSVLAVAVALLAVRAGTPVLAALALPVAYAVPLGARLGRPVGGRAGRHE